MMHTTIDGKNAVVAKAVCVSQIAAINQTLGGIIQNVYIRDNIGPRFLVEDFAASLQRHLEESSKDWLARQLMGIE